jgi:hypothetical protein
MAVAGPDIPGMSGVCLSCARKGQRPSSNRLVDHSVAIRSVFRRYPELSSARLLKDELDVRAIKSQSWTSASGCLWGGKSFSRGALYWCFKTASAGARSFTHTAVSERLPGSSMRPTRVGKWSKSWPPRGQLTAS